MFCHKCGTQAQSEETETCVSCGVSFIKPVEKTLTHWASLILLFVWYITFLVLGGDYYLQEINVWDYISIPISIAAFIAALVTIPSNRMVLKVISIIASIFAVLSTIGWVFG